MKSLFEKKHFVLSALASLAVFFLFFFLRFYNLTNRIGFGWDQEQFSYQIYDIIVNHKLTLLGPRVVSDTGFFLAPYFTYFLVPFYMATGLNAFALYYFLIFINIAFFAAAFFVVKKLFSHWAAVFFLAFWAVNSVFIALDVTPWWPVTLPIGIVVMWWFLKKVYDKNNLVSWIGLGLTAGLFMNMHFQFVFIILFSILFIIIHFFLEKKKMRIQNPVAAIFSFGLLFTPLVLFDRRHEYLNAKLFLNFFQNNLKSESDIEVWRTVFGNYLKPFFGIENYLVTIIFYIIIFAVLVFLIKNKKAFHKVFYLASMALWLLFPLFFMAYGKRPSEYYFIFLYPFIAITVVDFFLTIRKPILLVGILVGMTILNVSAIQKTLATNNTTSLKYKELVIKDVVQKVKEKRLNISYDVPLGWDNGYRYIFTSYGIVEQNRQDFPLIQIRIPPHTEDVKVGETGIYYPKELLNK